MAQASEVGRPNFFKFAGVRIQKYRAHGVASGKEGLLITEQNAQIYLNTTFLYNKRIW